MKKEDEYLDEIKVEKSQVRETLDEEKLIHELSEFFTKRANLQYDNLFIATLFLTMPSFGFILWAIYWGYKLFSHFKGVDLKKEEIVLETQEVEK